MASPFRVFRKYQKTLLAVAGVILMFVFVVGDSLFSYFGGGRNVRASEDHDAKATAVHWDGGKLSNAELRELVSRRQILNKFLQGVEMAGQRPSYEAGVDAPELRVQRLIAPDTPQQQVESSVVRTKLLAEAARDAGMKVSDDTLLQYLSELGRKNVSPEQMRSMLKNVGGGRLSTDYVLEALREEMLAHNFRFSHAFAFETVTPQQRWKDWMRVNDHAVVEAAAVPAEMYLADVKEPTDAELAVFFDKYKDRQADPDFYGNIEMPSATPGFRIPRKIDVQFIEGNFDEFLTKAEAQIKDEEVAKYYEEHKDLFPKLNTGTLEEAGKKNDTAKPDAPAAKTDAPAAKPDDAKKPAEPAEKKAEPPEKKEAPPASKDGKTDAKSSDAKKSSYQSNPTKSVFRLTAFAQDAEKKDAKADKPAEKAAEKSSEAPAAKANAGETKSAPPAEKPAAAPPAAPPAGTPDATKPAAAAPPAPAPKKPMEYQPLSEVKDEIRKRLAEGKVAEELKKLTGDIYDDLDTAFNKWRYSGTEAKELPAPPKSLTDFAAIAQKSGLKSGQTGPKSLLELRDLPVGKTSVADANRPLLSLLFIGHDLELYQPVKSLDIDGNRFVSMKVSDTPSRVPTLSEVKPEVVKAWKQQQAAELAQKHADEFAKKAQEAKTPLAAYFADNKSIKVIRTDPFSELTGGEASFVGGQVQQQPYRLSQPSEITAAGPDFLRGVFNLKDGEVAVLPNNDHSIAYVVRVVEHQPNLTELRNAYMSEAFSWTGENVMNQVHRQEANNLENDIEVSTNLKWDRDPDKAKNEQRDET